MDFIQLYRRKYKENTEIRSDMISLSPPPPPKCVDAFNSSNSNERMIVNNEWIGEDVEGSGCGLI
jgi:hypothetical protein